MQIQSGKLLKKRREIQMGRHFKQKSSCGFGGGLTVTFKDESARRETTAQNRKAQKDFIYFLARRLWESINNKPKWGLEYSKCYKAHPKSEIQKLYF